jgi:hypothetical protein
VRTEYAPTHERHGKIHFFENGEIVRTEYSRCYMRRMVWMRVCRCIRAIGCFSLCLRKAYVKVHRVHGRRKCNRCWRNRDKTHFTASQWNKGKRTCKDCQVTPETIPATCDKPIEECCVCLEEDVSSSRHIYFPCNHWVCNCCAESLVQNNHVKCPMCRSPVPPIVLCMQLRK